MADNEDPIIALTHQFSEFIKTSDERFKQLEAKMDKTACAAEDEEKKKQELAAAEEKKKKEKEGPADPMADGTGPQAFAALRDTLKQFSSQLEALGKTHKFATPPGGNPADDAATQKKLAEEQGKVKELGFIVEVRKFMADGKTNKLEAIRKAVSQFPELHKEFTAAGQTGQAVMRTL